MSQTFELKPTNKWVVIDPLKEDERVGEAGIIIAPSNALQKQHRMARVIAKDDCEEAKKFDTGDLVIYDVIGSVETRIGNQMFTLVSARNIMTVVTEKKVAVTKFTDILEVTGTKLPEPPPTSKPMLKVNDDGTLDVTSEEAKERFKELSHAGRRDARISR